MISKIKNLFDKDLLFSAVYQLWKLLSGPAILFLIPYYLTEVQQGYWYTFTSLSALSVFANLGFTTIVLQFSAHEFADFTFSRGYIVPRSDAITMQLGRLGSLFRFLVRWFAGLVVITFPIIFLIGAYLFYKKNDGTYWLIPWVVYVIGSGTSFINQGLLSFFEGCNQVARIQCIRFVGAVVNFAILVIFLTMKLNIYAIATATLASSIVINGLIIFMYGKAAMQLLNAAKIQPYSWAKDIFSLLWKYALSWVSGYFIFQLFTPLAFNYYGAEFAGKIGLSMSLIMAGFTMSNVWLTSVYPKINMAVAKKDWKKLDNVFKKRFLLGLLTYLLGFTGFYVLYLNFYNRFIILERLLPPLPFLTLLLAWCVQYAVNAFALYMRAHKEEPLVGISIVSGIAVSLSTLLIVRSFTADYMFLGFFAAQILFFPLVYKKYVYYKTAKRGETE